MIAGRLFKLGLEINMELFNKGLILLLSFILCLFLFHGCGKNNPSSSSQISTIIEKASINVSDNDQPDNLEFVYEQKTHGGWASLCPRMAGLIGATSGFEFIPTFKFNNNIYNVWVQWDEGDIIENGYLGPPPSFRFSKRDPSDTNGSNYGSASGHYKCTSLADCDGKCILDIHTFDLPNKRAVIDLDCTNLPAENNSDLDNLFGNTMTDFHLEVECDY